GRAPDVLGKTSEAARLREHDLSRRRLDRADEPAKLAKKVAHLIDRLLRVHRDLRERVVHPPRDAAQVGDERVHARDEGTDALLFVGDLAEDRIEAREDALDAREVLLGEDLADADERLIRLLQDVR